LVKQAHVDAADTLRVAHYGASFVADFPHCAFEWTIYNLQNKQDREPECFYGTLLPAARLLHDEHHKDMHWRAHDCCCSLAHSSFWQSRTAWAHSLASLVSAMFT
jgi:hypothetical protein